MNYETIDQIYDANKKVRQRLKDLVARLTETQITALPDGEKWTVAQIVEHISMVDEGSMKICAKLLKKAEAAGRASDGKISISDTFMQKGKEIAGMKVNAPEFVQPTGAKSIAESLAKLDENTEQLEQVRTLSESVDGTELKFPHPFFGDISAHEWLSLKGAHELRHIKQIENLVARIN